MNGLDLFSGIGGIGVALKRFGVKTIAYCEQNKYAQGVLLSRMQSGDIDKAPIFTDVRKLRDEHFVTKPDIIFGGFPCQDISVAGTGKGLAGERSSLFFEIVRLTKETGATFVFMENSPQIRTRGLRQVIGAFAEIGYDCRWTCLSAASIGANHERKRWFFMAHSKRKGLEGLWSEPGKKKESEFRNGSTLAYTDSSGCLRSDTSQPEKRLSDFEFAWKSNEHRWQNSEKWWKVEPDVGRVVDGIPYRVDRVKCLGNSVVVEQAAKAFERLCGLETITTNQIGGADE